MLYVDDLLITGDDSYLIDIVKRTLSSKNQIMKDLSLTQKYLEVNFHSPPNGLPLH